MSILSTAITGITAITHAQLSKYKHNNNTNANTTHKFIQIIKYCIKWFIHSRVRLPDTALPETMVIISKNRGTLRWNFFFPNSGFHQFLGFLPRHLTHHKCCQLSFYLCKLIILTFICNTAKNVTECQTAIGTHIKMCTIFACNYYYFNCLQCLDTVS